MTNPPRRLPLPLIGLTLLFLTIAGYAYARTRDVLHGPDLTILAPTNGATVRQPNLTIIGQAARVAELFLNGRQIYTNEQGQFREQVILSPGYNAVKVSATDRFHRQIAKTLEVVLQ